MTLTEQFLADLDQQGKSPHTLRGYRDCLEHFERCFWPLDGLGMNPAGMDKDILRQWCEKQRGDARSTIRWRLMVLRAFLRWLVDEGYAVPPAVFRFKPPKLAQRAPRTLSDEQIHALLMATPRRSTFYQRDRLLIRTLVTSGARVSEVARLTADDVMAEDDGRYVLRLHGKGNKDRFVRIPATLGHDLTKPITSSGDDVGCAATIFGLTVAGIQARVSRLAKVAGLTMNVTPHTFRHTYGTEYLRKGGNPFKLQRTFGHTSLSTTNRYVHFITSDLDEVKDPLPGKGGEA